MSSQNKVQEIDKITDFVSLIKIAYYYRPFNVCHLKLLSLTAMKDDL